MVVPTYRGPGYGADMAASMDSGAAGRLQAVIDNRGLDVDLLKSLMSNSEKMANVGGSAALSGAATQWANSPDIFGGEYAKLADARRVQMENATINAKNRVGTGGGGGGKGGGDDGFKNKSSEWIIRDENTGKITVFDPADMDANIIQNMQNNGKGITVLQYGQAVPAEVSNSFGPAANPTETIDGVTYDTVTGEVVDG